MVAGISGIGAIVAHDEHMSRSHFFTEREGAGVHAGADVRSFVDGHAVDRDRLAGPLAGHGVTGQADKSFDEVVAAESAAVLLLQPMVRVLEDHHVAALELEDFGGEFAGDDPVARFDGVQHGAGRNHVEAEQEHAHQQHDDDGYAAPDQGVS